MHYHVLMPTILRSALDIVKERSPRGRVTKKGAGLSLPVWAFSLYSLQVLFLRSSPCFPTLSLPILLPFSSHSLNTQNSVHKSIFTTEKSQKVLPSPPASFLHSSPDLPLAYFGPFRLVFSGNIELIVRTSYSSFRNRHSEIGRISLRFLSPPLMLALSGLTRLFSFIKWCLDQDYLALNSTTRCLRPWR